MATICTDAAYRRPDFSWPLQMLIGLAVTTALVVVFYFLIDQPVMSFVRDQELYHYRFLKWPTRPPEVFVILSPFVLVAGLLKGWFTPWTWAEKVAVAAAVSTLLTALAALLLKISFGRSADGFHPFHFGAAYWAFPSGHTACTLSVTAVVQVAIPRWRLCWWAIAGIVAAALIALTYHFVGDILGGAFVGWAIGGTVARLFGLETRQSLTRPTDLVRRSGEGTHGRRLFMQSLVARSRIYPVLLIAMTTGCQGLAGSRPLPVLARDGETHKPIPSALVQVSYPMKLPVLGPADTSTSAQDNGIARLWAKPSGDTGIVVTASADGYITEEQYVSRQTVQALEPAHLFEKVDRRPPALVVELYAETPRPTVELVVPTSYRGTVHLDVEVQQGMPCPPGSRYFRFAVPPSGMVHAGVPALFRHFPLPNFAGKYADGTVLRRDARDGEIGLWLLKSEGGHHSFLVGTRAEFTLEHPEPISDPEGSPSRGGGSSRGGRGRRNRGGDQSPANANPGGTTP